MRQPFSAPPPFDLAALQRLADDMARAGGGEQLTQPQVAELIGRWQPVAQPPSKHHEPFDLVTGAGEITGVTAPRWLCHLMGLCHRTVHLVLRTPQDWLALQVRGRHVDWPGRLDLSVTGHTRAGLSWQEAMLREAAEELGLDLAPAAGMVTADGLQPVGRPYRRCEADSLNPPVHICHVTQVFTATLTPAGLASLRFADGEVVGLYLCSLAEVDHLLAGDPLRIAPGLVQSLPVYLAHQDADH
jgi:isopentenyldiphosphate isomerase